MPISSKSAKFSDSGYVTKLFIQHNLKENWIYLLWSQSPISRRCLGHHITEGFFGPLEMNVLLFSRFGFLNGLVRWWRRRRAWRAPRGQRERCRSCMMTHISPILTWITARLTDVHFIDMTNALFMDINDILRFLSSQQYVLDRVDHFGILEGWMSWMSIKIKRCCFAAAISCLVTGQEHFCSE